VSPVGASRVLRGAWSRRDLNVGLGLVVAVATAATVAAPTFAGAAVSSLVRERVVAADAVDTDLSWAAVVPDPAGDLSATVDAAQSLAEDSGGRFERPVVSAAAVVGWDEVDPTTPTALAWRAGLCGRVEITGRCPVRSGEVLVAAGPAARTHPVGTEIAVTQSPEAGGPARNLRLTVVGTWAPAADGDASAYDASRWSPAGTVPTFTDCEGIPGSEITTAATGPLLTDLSTLAGLPDVTVLADAALRPSTDVAQVRSSADYADHWQNGEPRPIGAGSCAAAISETDIDGVVGPIDDERSRLQRQGIGAAAGAVLVGVLAVVLISTIAARRRRDELALVKLRGVRGVRLAGEAVAEPFVPLLVGAVAGVPIGWGVAAVAGRTWLGTDVATELPSVVWPLVGLVVALAALGVVTGLLRVLREPVHLQLRTARPQAASIGSLLGRVAAFVVAVVGVYQLRRADAADPPWWALAMPVVLGFVAGLVAVWLVRRVSAVLVAVSRRRRGNGAFLGSRRLHRGGDAVAFVPFAMAAIVLVIVAGSAWNVGAEWRESTALLRTGAPIAIASGKPVAATLAATRHADPDGRWLMTALSFPEESGRTYRRLYVDTPRWPQVLAPELAATPTDRPSDVDPDVLDALQSTSGRDSGLIYGTRVTLAATTDTDWYRASEPAELTLLLETADGRQLTTVLRVESDGEARAVIPQSQCQAGCRPMLFYLRVASDPTNWTRGVVTIDQLQLGGTDLRDLPWRLDPNVPQVSLTRSGEALRFRSTGGPIGLSWTAGNRQQIPVVTAGGLDLSSPDNPADRGNVFGADGRPIPADVVGDVDALPLIGDEGFVGDLSTFLADQPSVPVTAEVFVLARSDTPSAVRADLRAAGVDTGDVRPVAQTRELLDRDPYAQGLRFFWLVAAMVAVIGACAVGVALLSQRGTRSREAAALRVVGVRRRELRASVGLEVGVLAGLVAACAWLGAWASSRLILSVLPVGQPQEFEPAPVATTSLAAGLLPALIAAGALALAALALLLPLSVRARPAALRSGGG
jgi:putative ABC transport system permease protein